MRVDAINLLERLKERKKEQYVNAYFDLLKATHVIIAKHFGAGEKTVWKVLHYENRKNAPIRRMGFRAFNAFKKTRFVFCFCMFFLSIPNLGINLVLPSSH